MVSSDFQQFRERLLALRRDLENIAASSQDATRTVELDQARVGRISRMDAMQGQQMAQEADRRRQRQLMKIDEALRRIEAQTFGFCNSCGEEIDTRRLWADPTVKQCVPCATQ
jgi:DnaK suppressor protein